jgi:hypothetical protein
MENVCNDSVDSRKSGAFTYTINHFQYKRNVIVLECFACAHKLALSFKLNLNKFVLIIFDKSMEQTVASTEIWIHQF